MNPNYFRLPKPGTCDPYFGCTRSWWNEHILPTHTNNFKPSIKSISLKKKGAQKGVRLISFESACDFFESVRIAQELEEEYQAEISKTDPEATVERCGCGLPVYSGNTPKHVPSGLCWKCIRAYKAGHQDKIDAMTSNEYHAFKVKHGKAPSFFALDSVASTINQKENQ